MHVYLLRRSNKYQFDRLFFYEYENVANELRLALATFSLYNGIIKSKSISY